MDDEAAMAIQAEYEMQSTDRLHEREEYFSEQANFLHSQACTRGSRAEARARFHLRLIQQEISRRARPNADAKYPSSARSCTTLGEMLAFKAGKTS